MVGKVRKGFQAGLLTGAALLSIIAPAWAQTASADAGEQQTEDNGEIVVTAQKRAESVQDVPLAVTVVTG